MSILTSTERLVLRAIQQLQYEDYRTHSKVFRSLFNKGLIDAAFDMQGKVIFARITTEGINQLNRT